MKLSDLQKVNDLERRLDKIVDEQKKLAASNFFQGAFSSSDDTLQVSIWNHDTDSPFGVMRRVYADWLAKQRADLERQLVAFGVEL